MKITLLILLILSYLTQIWNKLNLSCGWRIGIWRFTLELDWFSLDVFV